MLRAVRLSRQTVFAAEASNYSARWQPTILEGRPAIFYLTVTNSSVRSQHQNNHALFTDHQEELQRPCSSASSLAKKTGGLLRVECPRGISLMHLGFGESSHDECGWSLWTESGNAIEIETRAGFDKGGCTGPARATSARLLHRDLVYDRAMAVVRRD